MVSSNRCVTSLLYWLILSARPFLGRFPGFQSNLLVVQVDVVTCEVPGFQDLTFCLEVNIAIKKKQVFPQFLGSTRLPLHFEGPSSLDTSFQGCRITNGGGFPTARLRQLITSRWGVVRSLTALDLPGLK